MAQISIDLRRRLVAAHESSKDGNYAATAALFGVDVATVARVLECYWETGDVLYKRKGYKRPVIDLDWLQEHLAAHPEARLVDRIADWKARSGRSVSVGAMWLAIRACGWTHQENTWAPDRAVAGTSK
jgi:hypothetical protein